MAVLFGVVADCDWLNETDGTQERLRDTKVMQQAVSYD
jgi:hypothetical protein